MVRKHLRDLNLKAVIQNWRPMINCHSFLSGKHVLLNQQKLRLKNLQGFLPFCQIYPLLFLNVLHACFFLIFKIASICVYQIAITLWIYWWNYIVHNCNFKENFHTLQNVNAFIYILVYNINLFIQECLEPIFRDIQSLSSEYCQCWRKLLFKYKK